MTEGEFYKLSRSLELMVSILKKMNQNDNVLADIYRYSKVVDVSPRGFDCTNAVSLFRKLKEYEKLDSLKEIILLMNQIIELNSIEDIKTMIMDEKDI